MPHLRLKRLPRRYAAVLRSVALSASMTAVVSLVVTIQRVGICLELPGLWLADWQFACAIAVPSRFLVAPLVTRFIGAVVERAGVEHPVQSCNRMGIKPARAEIQGEGNCPAIFAPLQLTCDAKDYQAKHFRGVARPPLRG